MRRILTFMRAYRAQSVLAPLFKMLEAAFELFIPLVVAEIIDNGITNADAGVVLRMCALLLALAVIGLVCSITAQYFAAKAAVGAAAEMRGSLFKHILSLGYSEMDSIGGSTLITRMTSDVNQVQNGINLVLRLFLRSPFIVFGAMIMAFTIDGQAALIFVAAIALLALVVFGVMSATRPRYKKIQGGLDGILGVVRESLTGARVIRAFGREEDELQRFKGANEALTGLQRATGRVSALTNPLTLVIVNAAVIALIRLGAVRVDAGTLSQGQVVALYNYMSQILVELIKLANLIVSVTKALACANRIDALFAIAPGMTEGAASVGRAGAPEVEFRGVSFAYASAGGEALSDVSFTARKGQMIGVIGGTGSGKSTLVNLIPRFYDATAGEVLVNGVNVKDYSEAALRAAVAVVPQRARLFSGSIGDNLTMGKSGVTGEAIERALAASQAKEFVDGKAGRLQFRVEQGGRNLSGGQRQRLTIARALVAGAEILIMDDSASALDFATDARLRQAVRALEDAPTVFVVSQRASSVMHADAILVLDGGKLVGAGTHDELMRDCAVYREIYWSQFKREA